MTDFLDDLFHTLSERKKNPRPNSYTTQLLQAGEDEIVKKVGEETIEVILAAKSQGNKRVVEETADLLYHLFVLLISRDLTLDDIRAELTRRQKPQ